MDEEQVVGLTPDMHASLILIEAGSESASALLGAARRIRSQLRASDSVLLLKERCALLLPATPFSGAQAMTSRLTRFLTNVPCEIHVYHGTTALLVLQRLCATGATTLAYAENPERTEPIGKMALSKASPCQGEKKEITTTLPYLAFLTRYPAPHLLYLLPYELACRHQCVPIGVARKMLTLATCRWLNREVVAQLREATRRGIFQVRCEATMIDEVLRYWQRLREKPEGACSERERDTLGSCAR